MLIWKSRLETMKIKYEKTSGVYTITNVINSRRYVGSTTDFRKRLMGHIKDLQKNIHANFKLQKDWNEYGGNVFLFEMYLLCERKDLIEEEQKLINLTPTELLYNINLRAGSMWGTDWWNEEDSTKIVHGGVSGEKS